MCHGRGLLADFGLSCSSDYWHPLSQQQQLAKDAPKLSSGLALEAVSGREKTSLLRAGLGLVQRHETSPVV